MSKTLVTLATFSALIEANIARIQLEADGVRAFLADDETVGMAWHLCSAVGGIKLQVGDDDVERALVILEANDSDSVTEDDWQAVVTDDTLDAADVKDEPESPLDEMLDRALRAAIFGLLVFPLQLYSLWLLLQVAFGSATMTDKNRRRALTTLILDLPITVICVVLVGARFH